MTVSNGRFGLENVVGGMRAKYIPLQVPIKTWFPLPHPCLGGLQLGTCLAVQVSFQTEALPANAMDKINGKISELKSKVKSERYRRSRGNASLI